MKKRSPIYDYVINSSSIVGSTAASLTNLQSKGGLERLIGHLGGELLDDCLVSPVLRHDVDRRGFQGACDHKKKESLSRISHFFFRD